MKWTSAFNLGILSGAILGVLFAPHKGSETRARLAQNAKKCKNKMDYFFGKRNIETDDLVKILKDDTADITPEMRNQLLALLKRVQD